MGLRFKFDALLSNYFARIIDVMYLELSARRHCSRRLYDFPTNPYRVNFARFQNGLPTLQLIFSWNVMQVLRSLGDPYGTLGYDVTMFELPSQKQERK